MARITSKNCTALSTARRIRNLRTSVTHKRSKATGFTLVEVSVVLALVFLLGVAVFSSLTEFRKRGELDAAVVQVLSILRLAQARTLASESDAQYGVHFETDRITLFQGTSYIAGAPANEVSLMPRSVLIGSISFAGGGTDVLFDRLTGHTASIGTVSLSVGESVRVVTIEASGEARSEVEGLPPENTRFVDARHVNFILGWSVQSATTLRFRFSSPPDADVVTDVPRASVCSGAPWTDCDWSGAVNVYGSFQTLRVHTTELSASSTTLSVDRDRRTNTKAVMISIIDGGVTKDIASYTAAGTTTVNAFGGTMVVQ